MWRVTCISNSWSFVVDFGRPITLLSPKNLPGTHQYAVTLVAQIVAQILGVLLKQNLLDKVSWHMNLFPVLPNKYYTFVTSPFLSASPSPAPVCSIFWSPNRLDLWLDLCLKLLFSWTKSFEGDKRCCGWHLSQIHCHFVRFWEVGHPLITKKHARNTPICGHTFTQQKAVNMNASQCKCNACKGCLLHKQHSNVSSPKKMAAQSASIIQIYAESSPSRSLGSIVKPFNEVVFPCLPHCYTHGSIVKLYMCYAHSAFEQII